MKKKKVSISTFHIVWYNNIFYILNEYYAYIFIYILSKKLKRRKFICKRKLSTEYF